MQYLLEFFDFFKSEPKPELNNWLDKIKFIETTFNKIKLNEPKDYYYLSGEVDGNTYDVTYNTYSKKTGTIQIHLMFKDNTNGYEVIDFGEVDFNSKSNKGHYEITKLEYDTYIKLVSDISGFLDDKSEKNFNKSGSFISDDGKININPGDLELDQLNYELDKVLGKYIGNEFEFELGYDIWDSSSSNKKMIDRKKLKIDEIRVDYGGGRFFATIETIGMLNEKCSIWVEPDYKVEYVDIEKIRLGGDKGTLKMDVVKVETTRKQQRELNRKYPNVIFYDITPTKYDSIEFLIDVVGLLKELNNNINK